ncbi:hypothetical protein FD754_007725 [Muntiacus muntjak]|uniref:Protein kish n=1 Tax=Muntiacus muntjak TaxID=9888 RepID=A0A5N3WNZ0_MUNMU|nr:hypothetical protein FD754_007725 [Muntiacus muntjak]
MSAIFNFQSLLTVILLLICTCAYIRSLAPSLLDRNKTGFLKAIIKVKFWACHIPFNCMLSSSILLLHKTKEIACLFLHFKVYMIQLAV